MVKQYFIRALFGLITILGVSVIFKDIYMSHYLKLEISSDKELYVQVFYDIGNGFNESNSKIARFKANKNLSVYTVKLPNKKIYKLRIDPLKTSANFKIKSIKIDNKLTTKKYLPEDIKKNILSIHQIDDLSIKNNYLVGLSIGDDPYIIFNDFISSDFKIGLWFKIIFMLIFYLFAYIVFLGALKLNKFIIFINNTKFVSSLNFKYRIDMYLYAFLILIIIVSGSHTAILHPSSFIRGLSLTIVSMYISLIGWIFMKHLPDYYLSNILRKPFHNLFIGQLLLFFYIYLRSVFNEYIYYVPISFVEFIVLSIVLIFVVKNTIGYSAVVYSLSKNKIMLMFSFGLFFIVMVGLSENELPRIFMLSTDPDQHAFFGKQIERFGTIPYQQFFWGHENFNYPAGTGVVSYLWSSFTFFDIRNALTIQPLLQVTISVFILSEILTFKSKNSKTTVIVALGLLLVIGYLFRYSFNIGHLHLEGTGRLMSISLSAFITSFLIFAFINKHKQNTVLSVLVFIVFMATIMFYSATLNPINIFYTSLLLGISFLVYFGREIRYYFLIPFIFIFYIYILLDPYYVNLLIDKAHNNIVDTVHYKSFDLTLNEFMVFFFENIKNRFLNPLEFFNFIWLKGQYTYLFIFTILFGSSIFLIYKKRSKEDVILKYIVISICLVFMLWIILSSFLYVLSSSSTNYRLLYPYFNFSTMQYNYILILLLVGFVIFKLASYLSSMKQYVIASVFFILLLIILDLSFGNTQYLKRVDFGINSLSEDDYLVIKEIENKYNDFMNTSIKSEVIPKILLINSMPIMGDEKWLFPVASSRVLPFYNTFPLAFYYFKGENYYTYDNYNDNVCKNFNLDWLKSKNIKYIFIPSDRAGGCIYKINNIISNYTILNNYGQSYFIELHSVNNRN